MEPITHPNYTAATRKRKKAEHSDKPDKTLKVGYFAVVDLENTDPLYRLRLGLVKITRIAQSNIHFQWYTYAGYPHEVDPQYTTRWQLQVLAGKGQKVDVGVCSAECIILTFPALTKSKTIPNVGRCAPAKMIARALSGEFGRLPSDKNHTNDSSEYEPSESSDDDAPLIRGGAVAGLRRSKRFKKM